MATSFRCPIHDEVYEGTDEKNFSKECPRCVAGGARETQDPQTSAQIAAGVAIRCPVHGEIYQGTDPKEHRKECPRCSAPDDPPAPVTRIPGAVDPDPQSRASAKAEDPPRIRFQAARLRCPNCNAILAVADFELEK